jgi:tetratricopeptide (TPR) repeat protein
MNRRQLFAIAVTLGAVLSMPRSELTPQDTPRDKSSPSIDNLGTNSPDSFQRALEFEKQRQWGHALRALNEYRPKSFCGTCLATMRATRAEHIAFCHAQLGEHSKAAEVLWQGLNDPLGWSNHLALSLFQLYRDAGQLDDLYRSVATAEKAGLRGKSPPVVPLRKLQRIQELRDAKAVHDLVAICRESNSTHRNTFAEPETRVDWESRAAAEALAGCGAEAVDAIEAALINRRGSSISWLIFALGKNQSPKALLVLQGLLQSEKSYERSNVIFAVAMHGKQGEELLAQIGGENLVKSAREFPPLRAWPRPKASSLPKSLYE